MNDNDLPVDPTPIDPNACPICGARRVKVGDVENYESDWCRRGKGRLMSRSEFIGKVCQHASRPGCIALASIP